MKRTTTIAFFVGLAGLTALVAWQGIGPVMAAMAHAGVDVLWLVPLFALPLAAATAAWWLLYPPRTALPVGLLVRQSWYALAINWLLPVAQVGGEIARARLARRSGSPAALAAATVVVDKTLQLVAQVIVALLGFLLFLACYAADTTVVQGAIAFVALFGLLSLAFYRAQKRGLFGMLATVAARFRTKAGGAGGLDVQAEAFDGAVRAIYSARGRLALALLARVAFRLLLVIEVWLAMQWLGHPVSWLDALILESLSQAVRAAAFLIPAGLGAQEGGFVALAVAMGISPAVGLALSLCKRVRELGVGVPGLAAWQWAEVVSLRRGATGQPGSPPGPPSERPD